MTTWIRRGVGSPKMAMFTSKGQIKPKADWRAVDSPNEFVLFAFLLFTANKTNSFFCFLGESMVRQSCFRFYLTFSGHVEVGRWSKKGQNCVHLVIEWPLSTLFVLLFVDSSETLYRALVFEKNIFSYLS